MERERYYRESRRGEGIVERLGEGKVLYRETWRGKVLEERGRYSMERRIGEGIVCSLGEGKVL